MRNSYSQDPRKSQGHPSFIIKNKKGKKDKKRINLLQILKKL